MPAFADAAGELRVVLPVNSLHRVIAAAFNGLDELRSQVQATLVAACEATRVQRDIDDIETSAARTLATIDAASLS